MSNASPRARQQIISVAAVKIKLLYKQMKIRDGRQRENHRVRELEWTPGIVQFPTRRGAFHSPLSSLNITGITNQHYYYFFYFTFYFY